jgi:hypothetical protein
MPGALGFGPCTTRCQLHNSFAPRHQTTSATPLHQPSLKMLTTSDTKQLSQHTAGVVSLQGFTQSSTTHKGLQMQLQTRDACTWLLRYSSRVHLNMLDGTYILSADVASHGASGTIKVIYGCCTCSLLQLYPESSSHRDTWPRALSNRHRHTYNKAQKGASQAGCCSVLC